MLSETAKIIYDFVAKNYGKGEANDPSWSIPHLAQAIDNRTQLFMVVADFSNSIRNNLEIVDYNLSYEEARKISLDLQMGDSIFEGEDWELDKHSGVKIIPQATRI